MNRWYRSDLSTEVLKEEAWLEALLDSKTNLRVPVHGYVSNDPPVWTTTRRRLPLHVIYLVTQRSIEGTVLDKKILMGQGELIWMMPGVEHHLWIPKSEPSFSLYYFRLDLQRNNKILVLDRPVIHLKNAGEFAPLLQRLRTELKMESAFRNMQLRNLWSEFSIDCFRREQGDRKLPMTLDSKQKLLLTEYYEENVLNKPQPRDLARLLRLSHDYFSRAFKRSFGMTPRHWLLKERMRMAANRLVESDMNISELSDHFGYDSVFMFSRQFKQIYGVSPRAYRNRLR